MLLLPIREATQISCWKKGQRKRSPSLGLNFLICNVGKIPVLAKSRTIVRGKRTAMCERWSDMSPRQWGRNSIFVC